MATNESVDRRDTLTLTQALHGITSALRGMVRPSELRESIVKTSAEILNAEAASLFLIEKGKMRMKAGYGASKELVDQAEYEKGRCYRNNMEKGNPYKLS